MNNKGLRSASKNKKDEFYTQLSDIEKELKNYQTFFDGKVVFCNCDDPEYSNFWKYFELNFEKLNIKKLIATHYCENDKSYKLELFKKNNELVKKKEALEGDGDFRSEECKLLLKQCDVVVTNPPFSLFREFVSLLIEYKKKFLIIGNQNAITYKTFFPLIKNNCVWLGQSIHSGDREFSVPDDYPLTASNSRTDEFGKKYVKVKGVRWWTNIDYPQRYTDLVLYKKYNPEIYQKYDNYNAINVDKTKDIPCDYDGFMGVPITFLDKYNPNQFELIGIMNTGEENPGIRYENTPHGRPIVNGQEKYLRLLIKKRG